MSVNNPFTGQQAVRVQPSVDDIFKLYVSNRLRGNPGFDEEINLFLNKLAVNIEKSVSLSSEQQLTCLEGLSKLEIYQRTEQVHLNLESFQSMTVVLCNKIASMFQDGEITWQKILQILDAVSEVIANIPEMVYLVDQLSHYSETIHVSSEGQTIGEWISSVGQLHHYSETIPMSSGGQTTGEWMSSVDQLHHYSETVHMSSEGQTIGEWNSSVEPQVFEEDEVQFEEEEVQFEEDEVQFEEVEKVDTTPEPDRSVIGKPIVSLEEYSTKCPCGSIVFWPVSQYKKCDACKKHPCLIEGCNEAFKNEYNLQQHLATSHTDIERKIVNDKRNRYEDAHCAHCRAPTPARGVTAHTECSSCRHFICLRGHCRAAYKRFRDLQIHLTSCNHFFPEGKCGCCGGEKKRLREFTKCPNSNCLAFWCGWCNFEGGSFRSIRTHIRTKHQII